MGSVHPIDAANALYQPSRVPWYVVIEHDGSAMERHAFRENFG
jgi:hypothetical protein